MLASLAGCGTYKLDYVVADGRKVQKWTTYSPGMISRDTWAESEPGSGKYAPTDHASVAGVLQTVGTAVVQGSIGLAGAVISPAAVGGAVVNVIATGGNGGAATANSQ